jgi:hypothetical protein
VGADRHTAGDQLTTMVCWKLSPRLVDHLHAAAKKDRSKREKTRRPTAIDFPQPTTYGVWRLRVRVDTLVEQLRRARQI